MIIWLKLKDEHEDIAETAVVGFPHDTLGEGIYAYVVLKNNATLCESDLIRELKVLVKNKISSFAVPQHFLVSETVFKKNF